MLSKHSRSTARFPEFKVNDLTISRWWFLTRWWFPIVLIFTPTSLGKWCNLTNVFQRAWKHRVVKGEWPLHALVSLLTSLWGFKRCVYRQSQQPDAKVFLPWGCSDLESKVWFLIDFGMFWQLEHGNFSSLWWAVLTSWYMILWSYIHFLHFLNIFGTSPMSF